MIWNRRQFLSASAVALATPALNRELLWAQAQPSPTPTSFTDIRGGVAMFSGRGGTIGYYLSNDALIVVDTQFPDTAKACLDGLKQKTQRQIDVLFYTHHHGDHTGGGGVFRPAAKAIVAHTRVPELQKMQASQQPPNPPATPPPAPTLPDKTFDKTWTATAGAERATGRHYGPGHTGGDSIIVFEKANVVHMGDLMFNRRHPFVDRPAGASIRGWMNQLGQIVKEHSGDTIYIAGHAKDGLPVTVKQAEVLAFRDYFTAVLDHVQKGMAASKSKEEITKLEALPKFEDYMGAPPRLTLAGVLGVAYDELTSKS